MLGNRRTDLRPGELVTGLRVPKVAAGGAGSARVARSTFLKLGSRAYLVISIVAVAAVLVVERRRSSPTRGSPSGRARRSRVRLRGLERDASRAAGRRGARRRSPATEHLVALAPIDDVRGTGDYRRDAALTLVRRAIAEVAS